MNLRSFAQKLQLQTLIEISQKGNFSPLTKAKLFALSGLIRLKRDNKQAKKEVKRI